MVMLPNDREIPPLLPGEKDATDHHILRRNDDTVTSLS